MHDNSTTICSSLHFPCTCLYLSTAPVSINLFSQEAFQPHMTVCSHTRKFREAWTLLSFFRFLRFFSWENTWVDREHCWVMLSHAIDNSSRKPFYFTNYQWQISEEAKCSCIVFWFIIEAATHLFIIICERSESGGKRPWTWQRYLMMHVFLLLKQHCSSAGNVTSTSYSAGNERHQQCHADVQNSHFTVWSSLLDRVHGRQ